VDGRPLLRPRDPAGQPADAAIQGGEFVLHGLADGRDMAGVYDVGIVAPEVPAKYQSPETSELTIELVPQMLTGVAFDLVD
jgi:hypothetical protein